MVSIILGLGAALAWGVHDLLVRIVSQTIAIPVALFTVLTIGTVVCLPAALYSGDWGEMSTKMILVSIAALGA